MNADYQNTKNIYPLCDSASWLKLTLMFHIIMCDSVIISDVKSLWEKNSTFSFSTQDLGIISAICLLIF